MVRLRTKKPDFSVEPMYKDDSFRAYAIKDKEGNTREVFLGLADHVAQDSGLDVLGKSLVKRRKTSESELTWVKFYSATQDGVALSKDSRIANAVAVESKMQVGPGTPAIPIARGGRYDLSSSITIKSGASGTLELKYGSDNPD